MIEIERKFLVKNLVDVNLSRLECLKIQQWYISFEPVVRVRISNNDAFITIKGKTKGISKLEVETQIKFAEAEALFSLKKGHEIHKLRYLYPYKGNVWEIDLFKGDCEGLVVAEIELGSESQKFDKPDFIGKEVSDNKSYSNASLSVKPRKK